MTSASVWNLNTGATGPKVSSREHSICGVASASRVGSKKLPPAPSMRLPPASSLAPSAMASATWVSTFCNACSSISGPTWMPASKPLPVLSAATRAANFSRKAS